MSSIDERIVEMKFDSKQFEAGVKNTLASLGLLKQGLNLDSAKNSLNGLNDAGKSFSLSGIADGVDAIASKFNGMGAVGFSVIQSLTTSALNFGRTMLTSLTNPLVEGGKQRALTIEQAKFQFQGLGMDVNDTMASAREAVLGTAYSLADAAKAASMFGASGMKAGKGMTSSLRGIAGVAAMTGSSYEDISNIFTSVSGNGRLMGNDLLQLSSRGVNAAATLAKSMGKTEAQVRDMVTKGQISFKMFSDAMDGAFGAHAADANKTYAGSLANMKAALSRLGADVATPSFEALRKVFNALSPQIDTIHKALTPLIDAFTKISVIKSDSLAKMIKGIDLTPLTKAIPIALSTIKNIVADFAAIFKPIASAFREIFPASMGSTLLNIATALQHFTASLAISEPAGQKLRRTFAGIFAVLDILWSLAKVVFGGFAALLGSFFGGMDKSSGSMLGVIARIGDWLVVVDKAIKKSDLIKNIGASLSTIFAAVKSAFTSVFPPATIRQFGDIAGAIQRFATSLKISNPEGEKLRRTFAGIFAVLDIVWTLAKIVFNGFVSLLSPFFGGISTAGGGLLTITSLIGDWLTALDKATKKTGFFSDTFGKLSKAVAPVGDFLKEVGDRISAIVSSISSSGFGLTFDKVSTSIDNFRSKMSDLISGPLSLFKPKMDTADTSISTFSKGSSASFDAVSKAMDKFNASSDNSIPKVSLWQKLGDGLKKVWSAVADVFEKVFNLPKTLGQALGGALTSIWTNIAAAIGKIDPNVLMGTVNLTIFGSVALMLKRMFSGGILNILTGGFTKKIANLLFQVNQTLQDLQNDLKADALKKLAEAIAFLAGSIYLLALVPADRLVPAMAALVVMLTMLLSSMQIMSQISNSDGYKKMPAIGLSLVLFGLSLLLFAESAKIFGSMNSGELALGLNGLIVVIAAIGVALWAFQKESEKLDAKKILETSGALIVFSIALMSMALVVKTFAMIGWKSFASGMGMVAITLTAIILALKQMPKDALLTSKAILTVAEALLIMSGVMVIFSLMKPEQMVKSVAMLAVTLYVLTTAMNTMSKDLPGVEAIVSVAAAMLILSFAMKIFSTMTPEAMLKSVAMLAMVLAIITTAMNTMTEALPGAAALLVVAAALWILTPIFVALGNLPLDVIGKAILALAGIFLVFIVAAYALAPVVVVLAVFGAAIALLGLGVMFAGEGLFLMGVGLAAIATAGAAAIPIFLAFAVGIIKLLPMLASSMGAAMSAFAESITASAPVIIGSFQAIALALIDSLKVVIPAFLDLMFMCIKKLLTLWEQNMPFFIDAGMKIITSFLKGVAKNLPNLMAAGTDLIVAFLKGIGDNAPRLADQAYKTIIAFINGLSAAVDANAAKIGAAAGKLAVALGKGLVHGIGAAIREVAKASGGLAKTALNAIADAFDSHSPSKATYKIGMDAVKGLTNGFDDLSITASMSAANVGDKALNALKTSIAGISDAVSGNIDIQPTIRPVLDLSGVQKDASLIGGMLSTPKLSIDTTYASAVAAAAALRATQTTATADTSSQAAATKPSEPITFIQNNNSPKALSNIEIYRQTRNQISAAKGALSL